MSSVAPVLPSLQEFSHIRRRWRAARSMLRRAIRTVDVVFRMQGVPEDVRMSLLYQRGQLGEAMCNMWWMSPSRHRSLANELRRVYEVEEMVDTNVDCLNSVIEDYHPVLPMICAENLDSEE